MKQIQCSLKGSSPVITMTSETSLTMYKMCKTRRHWSISVPLVLVLCCLHMQSGAIHWDVTIYWDSAVILKLHLKIHTCLFYDTWYCEVLHLLHRKHNFLYPSVLIAEAVFYNSVFKISELVSDIIIVTVKTVFLHTHIQVYGMNAYKFCHKILNKHVNGSSYSF